MGLLGTHLIQSAAVAIRDRTPLRRVYEKRLIDRFGIERGLEHVRPAPVVMTDYMDTIVRRSLSLFEVLERWSSETGQRFGIDAKQLYGYRFDVISGPKHNTIPVESIYDDIACDCIRKGLLLEDQHDAFCTAAHDIEFQIEMGAQSVIPSTKSFLVAAKEQGSRIACVTDLRFSSADVQAMLNRHGLLDLFDQVISSADIGSTKQEGSLYEHALDIVGARPEDCLMIGDNLNSDCANASKHGIKSCWVA